uniref:alpha-sarcoglycan-like isoform X2 n=1 Tax=Myxine glutinosa TaxID=7769 RepID=UPI00358F7CD5
MSCSFFLLCLTGVVATTARAVQWLGVAQTNTFFYHAWPRDKFLTSMPSSHKDDPLTFRVTQDGYPDPPPWLRCRPTSPRFSLSCYGHIPPQHKNFSLEIRAYNRRTFQVSRHEVQFGVIGSNASLPHRLEFFLPQHSIRNIARGAAFPPRPSRRRSLLSTLCHAWGARPPSALQLLDVATPRDRGKRIPPGGTGDEGVFVVFGSPRPFPPSIVGAAVAGVTGCPLRPPPADKTLRAAHFHVDWCSLRLFTKSQEEGSSTSVAISDDVNWLREGRWGEEFHPPSPAPQTPRLFDFIVTIATAGIVALLLALLLAHVMCCRRRGRKARDLTTTASVLAQQSKVRQAAMELRALSWKRGKNDQQSNRFIERPLDISSSFGLPPAYDPHAQNTSQPR